MTQVVTITNVEATRRTFDVKLDADALRKLVRAPRQANVSVFAPGGGDLADIDLCDGAFVTISWETVEEIKP